MRTNQTLLKSLSLFVLTSLAFSGCGNLYGKLDDPETIDEKHTEAKALMDDNECGQAVDLLKSIPNKTSDTYQILGWAHMCTAGAKFSKVASTILQFNTSTSDLKVFGDLANAFVPQDATQLTKIDLAFSAFSQQTASDDRAVNKTISQMVKAALILAEASSNGRTVVKSDVSVAACASGPGSCTEINLSDAEANSFATAVSAALAAAQESSNLQALGSFAVSLNAALSSGSGTLVRYAIYNQMLRE